MKVTDNTLAELISYLRDLKTLIPSLPLTKKMYKKGTTVGQVTFHTTQSANFYIRHYILNDGYKRDREAEYTDVHSVEEILLSIENALAACKSIIDKNINLTTPLKKVKTVHSRGFIMKTVFETIQHVTAHTAEHYGEINNASGEI